MRALITGTGGQDGSFLAEFLLAKNYRVYGLVRRPPESMDNLKSVLGKIEFLYGDMRDSGSLASAIWRAWPTEIYNLAGQSFVPPSWVNPQDTFDVNVGGLARILSLVDAIKPDTRVYQAGSSEMYGDQSGVLDENSPMLPTSPYGVSKLAAHQLVAAYRNKGTRVVSGILFNHESERRGAEMVTMKIARHIARFAMGIQEPLELGNIRAQRDWGAAQDYVEAMWMMTQKATTDYVIGTGESHSVEDFLDACLASVGISAPDFKSKWLHIDQRLVRDGEIKVLCANPERANTELYWKPRISFIQMVDRMMDSELKKETRVTGTGVSVGRKSPDMEAVCDE
jgi:GDPmannose 4,6-dehydratase